MGIGLFCAKQDLAQLGNVYYFKSYGEIFNVEVKTKDSAYFVRVVTEPDSGTTLYNISEYYKNGKRRLIGKTSTVAGTMLQGYCINFYPNGKKQQVANYVDGQMHGDVFTYYPNGAIYVVKEYTPGILVPQYNLLKSDSIIKACYDSTGKALVTDGNGYYIGYTKDFKSIFEEGNIKSGLKDGNWKGLGEVDSSKITFIESYQNGKLVVGQATDLSGKIYSYSERETPANYDGGMEKFYNFLAKNIHYPKAAKEAETQGKVMLQFNIDKDGSLGNINVLQSPGNGLAEESVRVLKMTPKWIPGQKFGQIAKTLFIIPVNFTFSAIK